MAGRGWLSSARSGLWGTPLKRRLVLGGGTAVGAAGLAGWLAWPSESVATIEPDGDPNVTHLHLIAHPDDDLYFFNLDVQHAINAGHGVVNVCITGGEGNGRNGNGSEPPEDFEGYVAARYAGLRAAYAEMVGANRHAVWRREALRVGGATVELATLKDAPQIHMVFLNLWEDSAKYTGSAGRRLMNLWEGSTTEHHTLVPSGGPLKKPTTYTKDSLTKALLGLLDMYQPVVVRTLDPDPDPQVHDDLNPQYADQDGFSDHIDHTAAGVIAMDVLARWWQGGGGDQTVVEAYRGYYNRRWPRNLGKKALETKTRYTDIYAWNDSRECGEPSGCGDLKIGTPSIGDAYGASTVHRFPSATNWLQRNAHGQLFAAAIHQGRLTQWTQSPYPGEKWHRTRDTVEHATRSVHLSTSTPDLWYAMTIKATVGAKPEDHVRELLIRPFTFTSTTGEWVNLGNPESEAGNPLRRRSLGAPAAIHTQDGLGIVAVRDYRRRISVREQQSDGSWGDWKRLSGALIQDGLTAVATEDGVIEIFGAAESGVARWWRTAGSGWQYELLDTAAPAAPPTVVGLTGGGAMIIVRRAESSHLVAYYRGKGDTVWDITRHELGGSGGIGTVAALAPPNWEGRVALASGNDEGTVGFAVADPAARAMETDWSESGPRLVHAPALAMGADSRLVAAAIGSDGVLHLATQAKSGFAAPTDWSPIDD